jgi:hypothetical protein
MGLVRKDIDVNEHKRLFNFILRQKTTLLLLFYISLKYIECEHAKLIHTKLTPCETNSYETNSIRKYPCFTVQVIPTKTSKLRPYFVK